MIQKKGNLWYVVINHKDASGKWKKKWIPTNTSSSREARKIESDIIYKIKTGEMPVNNTSEIPTLRAHLKQWLSVCVKPPIRTPATYEQYEYIARKASEVLGNTRIDRLTTSQIETYLSNELRRGLSRTMIRLEYRILNIALKKALQWGLIAKNPMESLTPPPPQKSPAKALSPNDALTLIHISRKKGLLIYAVTLLGILCGLRRGEICGLRWDDVDFNKRTLYIRHSLNRYKNETIENGKFALVIPGEKSSLVLSHPKTDSSETNIVVPVMVVELLRELQDYHKKN